MAQNYYEVLGVKEDATADEIKKAYRGLARQFHPDVNKDAGAEDKFKAAAEAYETLSDTDKRRQYNLHGFQKPGQSQRRPSRGGPGFDEREEMIRAWQKRREQTLKRGQNLQGRVRLSFNEALFGTDKLFEFSRFAKCDPCNASGLSLESKKKRCTTCEGTGKVSEVTYHPGLKMKLENERACEACDQLGEMIENPCNTCKGKGRVVKRTTLNIKVPCGVEAGMTLNIEGQGHAGLRGGLTGDLHVEISVESSPHFTISGRNLIYNAKLAFPQAVLGDKIWIPVPTPTGMTLKPFEFKGGASSGQQLGSLAGFGRPWVDNADRRGNIVVVCEVVVPKEPSEKEKELLKQYLDLVKKGEASQEYK